MKIEKWKHENVPPTGVRLDDFGNENGSVCTHPTIRMSAEDGGCGLEFCNCSKGHWIMISYGYNPSTRSVSGVTVYFDNWGEFQLFLSCREMIIN